MSFEWLPQTQTGDASPTTDEAKKAYEKWLLHALAGYEASQQQASGQEKTVEATAQKETPQGTALSRISTDSTASTSVAAIQPVADAQPYLPLSLRNNPITLSSLQASLPLELQQSSNSQGLSLSRIPIDLKATAQAFQSTLAGELSGASPISRIPPDLSSFTQNQNQIDATSAAQSLHDRLPADLLGFSQNPGFQADSTDRKRSAMLESSIESLIARPEVQATISSIQNRVPESWQATAESLQTKIPIDLKSVTPSLQTRIQLDPQTTGPSLQSRIPLDLQSATRFIQEHLPVDLQSVYQSVQARISAGGVASSVEEPHNSPETQGFIKALSSNLPALAQELPTGSKEIQTPYGTIQVNNDGRNANISVATMTGSLSGSLDTSTGQLYSSTSNTGGSTTISGQIYNPDTPMQVTKPDGSASTITMGDVLRSITGVHGLAALAQTYAPTVTDQVVESVKRVAASIPDTPIPITRSDGSTVAITLGDVVRTTPIINGAAQTYNPTADMQNPAYGVRTYSEQAQAAVTGVLGSLGALVDRPIQVARSDGSTLSFTLGDVIRATPNIKGSSETDATQPDIQSLSNVVRTYAPAILNAGQQSVLGALGGLADKPIQISKPDGSTVSISLGDVIRATPDARAAIQTYSQTDTNDNSGRPTIAQQLQGVLGGVVDKPIPVSRSDGSTVSITLGDVIRATPDTIRAAIQTYSQTDTTADSGRATIAQQLQTVLGGVIDKPIPVSRSDGSTVSITLGDVIRSTPDIRGAIQTYSQTDITAGGAGATIGQQLQAALGGVIDKTIPISKSDGSTISITLGDVIRSTPDIRGAIQTYGQPTDASAAGGRTLAQQVQGVLGGVVDKPIQISKPDGSTISITLGDVIRSTPDLSPNTGSRFEGVQQAIRVVLSNLPNDVNTETKSISIDTRYGKISGSIDTEGGSPKITIGTPIGTLSGSLDPNTGNLSSTIRTANGTTTISGQIRGSDLTVQSSSGDGGVSTRTLSYADVMRGVEDKLPPDLKMVVDKAQIYVPTIADAASVKVVLTNLPADVSTAAQSVSPIFGGAGNRAGQAVKPDVESTVPSSTQAAAGALAARLGAVLSAGDSTKETATTQNGTITSTFDVRGGVVNISVRGENSSVNITAQMPTLDLKQGLTGKNETNSENNATIKLGDTVGGITGKSTPAAAETGDKLQASLLNASNRTIGDTSQVSIANLITSQKSALIITVGALGADGKGSSREPGITSGDISLTIVRANIPPSKADAATVTAPTGERLAGLPILADAPKSLNTTGNPFIVGGPVAITIKIDAGTNAGINILDARLAGAGKDAAISANRNGEIVRTDGQLQVLLGTPVQVGQRINPVVSFGLPTDGRPVSDLSGIPSISSIKGAPLVQTISTDKSPVTQAPLQTVLGSLLPVDSRPTGQLSLSNQIMGLATRTDAGSLQTSLINQTSLNIRPTSPIPDTARTIAIALPGSAQPSGQGAPANVLFGRNPGAMHTEVDGAGQSVSTHILQGGLITSVGDRFDPTASSRRIGPQDSSSLETNLVGAKGRQEAQPDRLVQLEGAEALKELRKRKLIMRGIRGGSVGRFVTGVDLALLVVIGGIAQAQTNKDEKQRDKSKWKKIGKLLEKLTNSAPDDENLTAAAAKVKVRPVWYVQPGETLNKLAEELFQDANIGWLIADINKERIQESVIEGKRVVELQSRQKIELPVWEDIQVFRAHRPKEARAENLVTLISQRYIESQVVQYTLEVAMGLTSSAVLAATAPGAAGQPTQPVQPVRQPVRPPVRPQPIPLPLAGIFAQPARPAAAVSLAAAISLVLPQAITTSPPHKVKSDLVASSQQETDNPLDGTTYHA